MEGLEGFQKTGNANSFPGVIDVKPAVSHPTADGCNRK
jgi:hypothetical protein